MAVFVWLFYICEMGKQIDFDFLSTNQNIFSKLDYGNKFVMFNHWTINKMF